MSTNSYLFLAAICVCSCLTACKVGSEMPDISSMPEFANLYGNEYFFKKGIGVHWVNLDRDNKGPAHYLYVTIGSNFDDPYTIKKMEYMPGGKFEVIGVRLCTLCFPDEKMYEIKLQGLDTEVPIFLADNRGEFKTSIENDGVVTFNSEVIGIIPRE